MKTKHILSLLTFLVVGFCFPLLSQSVETKALKPSAIASYEGTYLQGNSPLPSEAQVKMTQGEKEVVFEVSKSKKNGLKTWNLPIALIRGVTPTNEGAWVFWFGENDTTYQAYFEMKGAQNFAAEVNAAVKEVNKRGLTPEENQLQKERYESYLKDALRDSK